MKNDVQGWVDLDFVVSLSAQCGLGSWKTGEIGRADIQHFVV